jgi:hypothetical protein
LKPGSLRAPKGKTRREPETVPEACPYPWLDDLGIVSCPTCGEGNFHFREVLVDQLGVEVVVDSRGPRWRGHSCGRRGSVVRLALDGECGHSHVLQLAFYKGSVYQGQESVPSADVLTGEGATWLART